MIIVFFLALFATALATYSADGQFPAITIHFNNANTSMNQPQTQVGGAHVTTETITSTQSNAQALNYTISSQWIRNHLEAIGTYIQELPIDHHLSQLHNHAHTYQYRIAAVGCAALYLTLCIHLYCAKKTIKKDSYWAHWQAEKTLGDFFRQSSEQTTRDLLLAIQTKYTNPLNPTDFLSPIISFYTEVQKEIELLEYYQWLYQLYAKTGFVRCIPFGIEEFEHLQDDIDRALYIQSLFKNWIAHYNVQRHAHHTVANSAPLTGI